MWRKEPPQSRHGLTFSVLVHPQVHRTSLLLAGPGWANAEELAPSMCPISTTTPAARGVLYRRQWVSVRDFRGMKFQPVEFLLPDRGIIFRSLRTSDLDALGCFYGGLSDRTRAFGTAVPTATIWRGSTATPSIGSTSFGSWRTTATGLWPFSS